MFSGVAILVSDSLKGTGMYLYTLEGNIQFEEVWEESHFKPLALSHMVHLGISATRSLAE